MNTLLVSAYTPGYSDLAGRLAASAKRFGLSVDFTEYQSSGDWVQNGHVKPGVLMAAMMKSDRKRPVCWVDADAELVKDPSGLDAMTGDVAVPSLHDGKEVLSGTVWFAPTPDALWVLAAWQNRCRSSGVIWDQMALAEVLRDCPATITTLPTKFCYIPGTSSPKQAPVIVHHQASREVRAGTRSM